MQRFLRAACVPLLFLPVVAEAEAQPSQRPVNETTISRTRLFDRTANFWKFGGEVELESGDAKVYADDVEYWVNEDRIVATGNVSMILATAGIRVARWIGIEQLCASVVPSSANRLADASRPSRTIGENELRSKVDCISPAMPSSL